MNYFLDSVNPEEIEKFSNIISGVTSNPLLLKKQGLSVDDFLEYMKQYPDMLKFVQVFTYGEFKRIVNTFDFILPTIVFKVALKYPEGFDLAQQIKSFQSKNQEKFKISATMMYDLIQLNNAFKLGLDFSMVYIAKNDCDEFLEQAMGVFEKLNPPTKLVAASFRTKNDVKRAIRSGIHYATVPTNVLEKSLSNAQVELDWSNFI
jgi:transaldolase